MDRETTNPRLQEPAGRAMPKPNSAAALVQGTVRWLARRWSSGRVRAALAALGCAALAAMNLFQVAGAQPATGAALIVCTLLFVRRALQDRAVRSLLTTDQSLLETVIDALPYGIYVKDLRQRLVVVNRAAAEMVGMARQGLLGKPVRELASAGALPPNLVRRIAETDAQVIGTGQSVEFETGRILPAGRQQIRVIKTPLRDTSGEIAWILTMVEDISDRARAEQEAREQQALLRTVVDAIPHYLYVKDRADRFILVNRAMEQRLPQGAPSLIGLQVMLGAQRDEAEVRRTMEDNRRVMEEGVRLDFQRTFTVAPYGERTFRTIKVPLKNAAGETIGLVGLDEDETDRVGAERQVREQREFLQSVLDALPQDVLVKDRTGVIIMVNQRLSDRWKIPKAALIGLRGHGQGGVTAEDLRRIEESDRRVLKEGQPVTWNQQLTDPSGRIATILAHKVPLRDRGGAIVGLVMAGEDISALEVTRQELAESQRLLRTVLDAIPETVSLKGADLRYQLVNRQMYTRIGLTEAEVLGRTTADLATLTPQGKEAVARADRELLQTGRAGIIPLVEWQGPGDRVRWERVLKEPVLDSAGALTGIVTMGEDVTDLVTAQQEAEQARRLLRTVLDAIPETVSLKDTALRFRLVNQHLPLRLGLTPEQVLGRTLDDLPRVTAESKAAIRRAEEEVLKTGQPATLPLLDMYRTESGVRWHRVLKQPVKGEDGSVTGIVTINMDVTEIVKAQQAAEAARRMLQTVLEGIPESVSFKDAGLRYRVVNRVFAGWNGLTAEQMLGRTVDDLPGVSAKSKAEIRRSDEEALRTGQPAKIALIQLVHDDGGVRWERMLKQPVKDGDGTVTGIVTIGEDVTELVTAKQEAERAQRLLRTIMDTLPAGVFVKDLQRRFTMANAPFADNYALAPGDVIGLTSEQLPHLLPERKAQFADEDRRMIEEGHPVDSGVFPGPNVPGRPQRWFRVIKVPLKDDHGRMLGIVGLAEDVTAEKRAQEERLALTRLMQRTQNLESLGVMAAGIAHEFNNLLQRIMGHTELALVEIPRGHALRKDLETIQQAGRTAVALTNQMVTLSGRSRFKVEPVPLNGLVEGLLREIRTLLPRDVVLSHHLGGAQRTVPADEPLLHQVIVSLVINAAEALAESGGHVRLEVGSCRLDGETLASHAFSDRALPPGEYAYVEVRDSGPGIPPEILARIYEPFFSTKFIGRGLGLAAVRGIVHGHHGALHVRSKLGEGTAFRVLLPVTED
jgi:PAS domain S-box-containing protein